MNGEDSLVKKIKEFASDLGSKYQIAAGVIIVGLICLLLKVVIWHYDTMQNMVSKDEMVELQKSIQDEFNVLREDIDSNEDELLMIKTILNMKVLESQLSLQESNVSPVSMPILSENVVVGYDSDGVSYLADELLNETLILTYEEDGKDVYFLGQFNENYHWDGYCIVNVYDTNEKLCGICGSNFDDGKRMDYDSIVKNENGFLYSNRIIENGHDSGVNREYQAFDSENKNFTSENVRASDFMTSDDFINNNNLVLTREYYGDTVNHLYEDLTGKAKLVQYKEGKVVLLYSGSFQKGVFSDETGEAYSIVYSEEYNAYYYNTGDFKNGVACEKSSHPLSEDELVGLINKYDLRGYSWMYAVD